MVFSSCPVARFKHNNERSCCSIGLDMDMNGTFRTARSRLSSYGAPNNSSLNSVCLSKSHLTGSSQVSFSLSEDPASLHSIKRKDQEELIDTINSLTDRVNSIESRLVDMEESFRSPCVHENASAVKQIGSILYRLIKYLSSTSINH